MHSSQMKTAFGPASRLTCFWDFPQKLQYVGGGLAFSAVSCNMDSACELLSRFPLVHDPHHIFKRPQPVRNASFHCGRLLPGDAVLETDMV